MEIKFMVYVYVIDGNTLWQGISLRSIFFFMRL